MTERTGTNVDHEAARIGDVIDAWKQALHDKNVDLLMSTYSRTGLASLDLEPQA